jgi:uroporphyrinogen-III synthase
LVFLLLVIVAVLASTPLWKARLITALQGLPAEQRPEQTAAPATETQALPAQTAVPEQKPATTPAAPAPAAPTNTDALGSEIAALSARIAALEAQAGNSKVDELGQRVTNLEGRSANANSVLALADRVDALEKSNREAAAAQVTAVALLTAVDQLHDALAAGRPFALELETAKALAGRGGITLDDQGFASFARTGIPTLSELQRRFDRESAAVIRASLLPEGRSSWLRRVLDKLMSIVTIRRTDGEADGNSASAVLARTEHKLAAGDLAGAAGEMDALSGAAAQAAADWLAAAKARVAAERAISDASAKAIGALAAAQTKTAP